VNKSKLRVSKSADEFLSYDDLEVDETRPLVAMRRLQDALVKAGTI
jgi:predicted homoserine dehydrogenase-like protein